MNTMQLSCFTEVAHTLNFSQAANNLHVSQPTVSHQIRSLEEELGCTLLVRNTRSVRLTDEGFAFLAYADDILGLAAQAKDRLAHAHRPAKRQLRIGVHDGLEAQIIAPTLRQMMDEFGAFDPVIRMGPSSMLRSMLEDGLVDVVMEFRNPAGEPDGASVFHRLAECPAVCVCSTESPLAASDRLELDDLARGGRMAVGDPHHCATAVVELQRAAAGHIASADVMMAYNTEIALALVRAGVAFTVQAGIPVGSVPEARCIPIEGLPAVTLGVRVRRGRRPALLDRYIASLRDGL
ncbi:LysR family transcriptional regulator [uncultured Enorma sp.]|uniref:LysR family transcriptional regulator n=1 Tax=uncultured Enorma sp. TaxID=1714346 RepID=UPI0025928D58|nr:LysR family transcriptional regulator [uncultured Enorma sp.]